MNYQHFYKDIYLYFGLYVCQALLHKNQSREPETWAEKQGFTVVLSDPNTNTVGTGWSGELFRKNLLVWWSMLLWNQIHSKLEKQTEHVVKPFTVVDLRLVRLMPGSDVVAECSFALP